MATENNIKNKENQKEITLNDNKNDEQSKKVSEEFKEKVQKIIKNPINFIIYYKISKATKDYLLKYKDLTNIGNTISEIVQGNPDSAFDIVNGFTQGCFSAGKDLTEIDNTISKIVKKNPNYAFYIVDGFTKGCISAGKKPTDISDPISKIVKKNQDYAFYIIDGFTQGCISKGKKPTDISDSISNIVQGNPDSAFDIACGFTRGCFSAGKDLTSIGNVISTIISTNEIKNNQNLVFNIVDGFTLGCILKGKKLKNIGNAISTIISANEIKDNQDLVFNVINGFVQGFVKGCLMQKPDNIKDTAKSFFKLLNKINEKNFGENGKKIKGKLKPIFSLIVSQYFMNTLTNSNNKQLSKGNNKETNTEKKLRECYNKLFHEEDNKKIKSFKDIKLKKLLDLQDEYLKERFKGKGVDGGIEYEIFLKMAFNLILKSKENKESTVGNLKNKTELTVGNLEKQKDIFKDLKFIYLNNNDGITSKRKLFKKIGLKPEDFGNRRKGEFSDFSIVHCSYLNHGFVMIIDKTQEWKDAIDPKTESICLIDSSRYIEDIKTNGDTILNKKEQIFKNTPTLNIHKYQTNGTCWLNAMSAVGFLLEKQQECIAKQKQEQQEQVGQHEQQPRKPYGVSIKELLEGFGKKRDNESKKNIESATPPEKLSSFEQGICDYSTEHFYPLTDISKKERGIIKRILAEQVEQNKADQKTLSTASSRLEESKEEQYKESKNLIIKYEYLKESFERFKKDAERLEELCTKFNIDYTTLLEQEEDLDSKTQSTDSCLGENTEKLKEQHDKSNIKDTQLSKPEQKEDSYNIFSSCIPDNKEGQNPQNIKKQNETCCTIF